MRGTSVGWSPPWLPYAIAPVTDRRFGLLLSAVAFAAGIVIYRILATRLSPPAAIALVTVLLSLPVGAAKTATACGMNALASFSQHRQPSAVRWRASALFCAATVITATSIGLLLGGVGGAIGATRLLTWLTPAVFVLGGAEMGLIRLPILSSLWQVPARWTRCRTTAPVIWGFFLGSGLSTQMPHPSFYALLLLCIFLPLPLGAAVLGTYGLFRAAPALAATANRRWSATPVVETMFRLRLLGHVTSAAGCLAVAGALAAQAVS
jgi:hypothetical protein